MKDTERLKRIYSKTDGYCHLCHKKLSFHNHGKRGLKGAWHIEHSVAKANGGSNHLNNLFAACIDCNINKNTKHTRTIRRTNGVSRAPYNRQKKNNIRTSNTLTGAAGGAIIGSYFGPAGTFFGSIIGAIFGDENSPKK
jgi:5-methylcytosine-specific restriction endonuclease McrA